jgi:hypothetical protein
MIDVIPLPRDAGADIRFVLMVGAHQIDRHVVGGGIEILDRQFGGNDRAGAGIVGIKARHIGEHSDLHRNRILRPSGTRTQRGKRDNQACQFCCGSHCVLPLAGLRPSPFIYQTRRPLRYPLAPGRQNDQNPII